MRHDKIEKDMKSRLGSLKDAESRISQLKQQEKTLQTVKVSLSKKRVFGLTIAILGLAVSFVALVSPYFLAFGLPLFFAGLLFAWRSSPAALDPKLTEIRTARENLLGEKTRIDEYGSQMQEAQKSKEEQEAMAARSRQELLQLLSQLPSKPPHCGHTRRYKWTGKFFGDLIQLAITDGIFKQARRDLNDRYNQLTAQAEKLGIK